MNTNQKNKRNSFLRLRDIFNDKDNAPLIEGVKALKTAVADYLTKVGDLDELARRQSEVLTGISQDKVTLREIICEDALPIAGALRALAKAQSDGQLHEQMDTAPSDLLGMRDRDCADFCATISEKAEANEAKLVSDYGITADQLDKFAALVEALDAAVGKAKIAISRRKSIADKLKVKIKEIDEQLNDMLDELMLVFRERLTDTPERKARRDFFDAYTEARHIDDAPASRGTQEPPAPKPSQAAPKPAMV